MNHIIAKILREMSFLLEMDDVPFKPRAYEKAAFSLESLDENISEIYKNGSLKSLEKISGVGRGISEKIEEYIKTGKIKEYENLKKKIPINLDEFKNLEGVGPKTIKSFYKYLKIKNLSELKEAIKKGELKKIPRFGKKLEEKITKSIEQNLTREKRFTLSEAIHAAKIIEKEMLKLKSVKQIVFCGSLRRRKETIGDLDILIVSSNPKEASDAFANLSFVEYVYAKGSKKSSARLYFGINADLRIVKNTSFGAAMQYFTGNKDHNIALRKIAAQKNLKLNEYGLFKTVKGKEILINGKSEEEIYEKLGMDFIPPELREMAGEIEAAARHALPKLIELKDIKGDLQLQTNWTDGADSIEEMAKYAIELNYEYIAITDHTKSLAMTGGSDEKKLLKQIKEIEKINKSYPNLKILSGAEVNILKDGSLDINNETLSLLDFSAGAIHSHFHLTKDEQTNRLIKAMENPRIDIIFHPTGRIINKREPLDLDMERIFKTAAKTNTILEINAYPDRLDLKDSHIIAAKNMGVKFMINTDAHAANQMDLMEYGVWQARRGWLEKKDVLNTLPLNKLLEILKKPKKERF